MLEGYRLSPITWEGQGCNGVPWLRMFSGPLRCSHSGLSEHQFHSLLPDTGMTLGCWRLFTSHCTAMPPEMDWSYFFITSLKTPGDWAGAHHRASQLWPEDSAILHTHGLWRTNSVHWAHSHKKWETLGTKQPFILGSSIDVSLHSSNLTLNDLPAAG